jgi:hypothetical protein
MNKEAQIAPTTIVGIVLVVGAIILGVLFYLGIFGNDDLSERDLCRLSILSRATLPGVTQQAVPLNCQTEKICITTKDSPSLSPFAIFGKKVSDCEQFAGETNFRDINVKINGDLNDQAETKRIIEKYYSDAMYDCWTMTGQGKLDVFKGETSGTTESIVGMLLDFTGSNLGTLVKEIRPKCIVCSRIAISDKVYEADNAGKYGILSTLDFNKYLSEQNVPGTSRTYIRTFTDDSVSSIGTNKVGFDKVSYDSPSNVNQLAIIFMQIKTHQSPSDLGNEAAFLTGSAFVGGGLLTGTGRSIVFSSPAAFIGSIVAGLAASGGAYLYASGVQEENQAVSLASCRAYTNEEDAKLGCSLIKPVKWDVTEVNNLCLGGIEGNL